ncbi:MAG TPA: hypothetical protein VJT50_15890, partial [Pyrinomonadaceae bacterium]|nr:hypothetical protein [Pyrinomonadaceae bacterium]
MTRLAFNRVKAFSLAVCLLLGLSYFIGVPQNPPGFFVDESSIAFNANSIAQHGADEHGIRFPLFFRAFGEFKSPVYIYILAAIYKVAGPGIGAARLLSALFGLAAAVVLGLLAAETFPAEESRRNGRFIAGTIVFSAALLTPWLFEISRLVFEVALTPLALALLLFAVAIARRNGWEWRHSIAIALALSLLTYSYSVGRVLGPLLAVGLIIFAGSGTGWKAV